MKKVMFFLPALAGGGAERTVVNIINYINKNKYKIYLVLIDSPNDGKYKDEYIKYISQDVDIITFNIKINKINLPIILFRLIQFIYKIRPHIIFSTILKSNLLVAFARMFYVRKTKLILRESSNRSISIQNKILRSLIGCIYNNFANKVIALSQGVKYDLIENFGVDPNNIEVIYNPVDIDSIKLKMNEECDIKQNGLPVIITVGRLEEPKDHITLLNALYLLKDEVKFKALILGTGSLYDFLNQKILELGLQDYVELKGFQENPYKYMKHSDIFVLTSKWEGFGHVIVEAMVVGTPVISSNCNYGPSEIIKDEYGVLFNVGDHITLKNKILELIENEKLRQELSKKGIVRAQDFDVKQIVLQYEREFDKLTT